MHFIRRLCPAGGHQRYAALRVGRAAMGVRRQPAPGQRLHHPVEDRFRRQGTGRVMDEDSFYYALDGNWALPQDFSIGAHVGRTTYASALPEWQDYTDYSVTVGKSFGPLGLTVGYYDTDDKGTQNFGEKLAED